MVINWGDDKMLKDNINPQIENTVKAAMDGLPKGLFSGKIKPADLENVIRQYVTQNVALKEEASKLTGRISELEKENSEYETEIAGLDNEVKDNETQISKLQTDLRDNQQEYASLLEALVKLIPEEVLSSQLYKLEEARIKQAEAEDYRAQYDDVFLVEIGTVTNYFSKLGVAGIQLTEPLNQGEKVYFHIGDLEQNVNSMELNHNKITEAVAGTKIGLKVDKEVSKDQPVYKMV